EAVEEILSVAVTGEIEMVSVGASAGRVLAADLYSSENIPPFRRAPLDGYAFRSADTEGADPDHPVTLDIIEYIPAGKWPEHTVGKGQAVNLMTGAPVPEGADVVEKFEDCRVLDGKVQIFRTYKPDTNVVPVGEDIRIGDRILEKGIRISGAYCGILAGLGFTEIPVYKRPRIALISTGSELVEVGEELPPGKIRNSSIYTLQAFLEQENAIVTRFPIAADNVDAIASLIREAADQSDMIITTGGVSVGDFDLLPETMRQLDARILFWKLMMKPGMAYLASVYRDIPVISLSGNPSSAVISMLMTVIPAVRKMSGLKDCRLEEDKGKVLYPFPKASKARRFIPVQVVIRGGEAWLVNDSDQANGILHSLHGCNAVAEIKPGTPSLAPGDELKIYLL
ncbi:MAG: molybdopterin molybdotransferase MoeA, partial [Lachnospiraceae bacterium]|nr:molybdopterin molybdotransferase MoeA [Lachnospiraceae bacterium]